MPVIRRTELVVQRPRIKRTKRNIIKRRRCSYIQSLKFQRFALKIKTFEGHGDNRNIVFHNIISCMNWFVILFEKSTGVNEWQSEDNCVKKTQLDGRLILSIVRQNLQISAVSRPGLHPSLASPFCHWLPRVSLHHRSPIMQLSPNMHLIPSQFEKILIANYSDWRFI
jgi:hypothetical protein